MGVRGGSCILGLRLWVRFRIRVSVISIGGRKGLVFLVNLGLELALALGLGFGLGPVLDLIQKLPPRSPNPGACIRTHTGKLCTGALKSFECYSKTCSAVTQ